MKQLIWLVACSVFSVFLAGCNVTVDVPNSWRQLDIQVVDARPSEAGSVATAEPTAPPPTLTPESPGGVPGLAAPVKILDVRPFVTVTTQTLNSVVDLYFADGCRIDVALADVADVFGPETTVLAAITHITGAVPFSDGVEDPSAVFAPGLPRKIYWASDAAEAVKCSESVPWLWRQMAVVSRQGADSAALLVRSLPAERACTIPKAFTPQSFGAMLAERKEWPDFLAVSTSDGQTAVLHSQLMESCGSPGGCETVRIVCRDLFEDGAWRQWCESLCI